MTDYKSDILLKCFDRARRVSGALESGAIDNRKALRGLSALCLIMVRNDPDPENDMIFFNATDAFLNLQALFGNPDHRDIQDICDQLQDLEIDFVSGVTPPSLTSPNSEADQRPSPSEQQHDMPEVVPV